MLTITIPSKIAEELARRGIDAETYIIDLLSRNLGVDPEIAAEAHVELALKYLEEGKGLIDRDPVQASEKLYKAVEEVVKALTIHYRLGDILDRVNKRGRWTVTELEKAVEAISERLGDWFSTAWDKANYLHVWGFHEAKLDATAVRLRLPDIERVVKDAQRVIQR
jgi:Archaeal PaREP1/PaREP8 family.